MTLIRFVHTADLHLGLKFKNVSFNKEIAMERRRELWSTFKNIVEYARENADFLFIAGDLYEENYFTMADINRVKEIFKGSPDLNIIISAGNHDFRGNKSLYNRIEWPNNVTIFENKIDKKEFKEFEAVIYGYSWDRALINDNNILDDLRDDLDLNKNNILILHGDVAKSSDYLPISISDLESLQMDYIGLGHIHKPDIIRKNIAYSGCPEPLDFGESGERGIIEGLIKEKKTQIKFTPFSKRRFLEMEVVLNESMTYDGILDAINAIGLENRENDFYRINLEGLIAKDIKVRDIEEDLKEGFYYLEIIDNTSLEYDLDLLEITNKDNIISQFIKEMKEKGLDNPINKRALNIGLEELLKGR